MRKTVSSPAPIRMDATNLLLSSFRRCGFGFLTYGKKAGQFVPIAVGLI